MNDIQNTQKKARDAGLIGTTVTLGIMIGLGILGIVGVLSAEQVWSIYLVLGIIPATLFILTYAWRVPRWRKSVEGRHMMIFTTLIDILMIEELFNRLAGRASWHDLFLAFLTAAIVLVLWQRYSMLLWAQRESTRAQDRLSTPRVP